MPDPLARAPLVARCVIPTAAGPMTALATERGLSALLFKGDRHHPDHHEAVPDTPGHPHLQAARQWLARYWEGGNPSWTGLHLDWQGTAFQAAVWRALLDIPLGQTCSYGDLAARLQPPSAPRATGGAIGRNPLAVLVPCHRVVGADGALTGYASGLAIKQLLLRHEGVLPR